LIECTGIRGFDGKAHGKGEWEAKGAARAGSIADHSRIVDRGFRAARKPKVDRGAEAVARGILGEMDLTLFCG
jgi:hypothetical protein